MTRYNKFLPIFLLTFAFSVATSLVLAQDRRLAINEGFADPPAGYGEVPFWWWTGDKLDVERLNWQLDELARKGVSGVQVNYAHQDVRNAVQPNWLTYPNDPEVFTPEWFDAFQQVAAHCRELNMGVGLSGYTLDWQNSPGNLYDRLIYCDKDTQSRTLRVAARERVAAGTRLRDAFTEAQLAQVEDDEIVGVIAYPISADGKIDAQNFVAFDVNYDAYQIDLDSEVWIYRAKREPQTLNPLHPDAGKKVVERFFKPFESRAIQALGGKDDGSNLGLDYFFQDELQIGTGETIWTDDLPEAFQKRKGYWYWTAIPAMFGADLGPATEKYRLDYMDVRVKLAEERYFIPIYNWNAERERIYACDPGSRGKDPYEFCDYFSAVRWYTAPGHDTPGGHADFIKNKVSSSIAHFYDRPRVWLEGYHSFGWGAEPKQLFFATNENFLFGANLLNLHGLYYTTYGGYWEWAPPCYHFRQPYWETFGSFLKYFERLSFALTRGVEQAETVIVYPVSAYHAKLDGERARNVAFEAASRIYAQGRDILFIDDESLQRAETRDGKLVVAGGEHSVLVLPSLEGVRISTLEAALRFYRAGGTVVALDRLPAASDRVGRDDSYVNDIVKEIFGVDPSSKTSSTTRNAAGGVGAFLSAYAEESPNDEVDENGVVSKVREYPGGFKGRWVWAKELKRDVYLKWVVQGVGEEAKELQARFFCDNAGAVYLNGVKLCDNADYSTGWGGVLTLRDGDVIAIDGHDADEPRLGSAGLFFALSDGVNTLATAEDFRYTLDAPDDEWRKSADGVDQLAKLDRGNVHVLHRTGVNTELAENKNVTATDDARMWSELDALLADRPREVFDADTFAPCSFMKRATDRADIYFVMKGKKNAALAFRSQGRAEFYNAWDGTTREPAVTVVPKDGALDGTSVVQWPYAEDEAGLIVFWRDERPTNAVAKLEFNGAVVDALTQDAQSGWNARVYGGDKIALTTLDGKEVTLNGVAKDEASALALAGEWEFEILPTLDNRWGDYRLPASEPVMGPEAQRFDVEGVGYCLNDFGRKFYRLGPFPKDADLTQLEATLAKMKNVDPAREVEFDGKTFKWTPYSFSWRWGIEGNPGHEGYHGLKEKIDSRFIGLGAVGDGFNETVFEPEDAGSVYYLWSYVGAKRVGEQDGSALVDVYVSGGAPAAIYLDGKKLEGEYRLGVASDIGEYSPVLLRYDAAGRYACAFVQRQDSDRTASKTIALDGLDNGAFNGMATGLREETPAMLDPATRTPLATIWFDMPGVLEYELLPNVSEQRLSFVAPAGLKALNIPAYADVVETLVDGKTVKAKLAKTVVSGADFWQGKRVSDALDAGAGALRDAPVVWTTIELENKLERESTVSLTLSPTRVGKHDGAICPEPIRLTCEKGKTELGNWNERGVLENYSGGAKYAKTFSWNGKTRADGKITLDLGAVGVSCRVYLNGKLVADKPTPPWTLDVADAIVEGENLLEVEVYNAAVNLYKNIPSRYKNQAPSGLIGPVRILFEPVVKLSE